MLIKNILKACLKLLVWVSFVSSSAVENDESLPLNREGRVIVQIPGTSCATGSARYPQGTCDGWFSCLANKGAIGGICPTTLGACCIVKRSCGGSISAQAGYFYSRGYPTPTTATGVCSVTITKNYWDIQQVRLDFLSFTLAGPNANGQCATERMIITGGDPAYPIPVICGNNDDQHMYVNFGATDTITVTFNIAGTPSDTTKWNIQVTQLRASDALKAPDGCLQYYIGPSGTVSSFGSALGSVGTQHLADQVYDICIQKAVTPSTIVWTEVILDISPSTADGNICVTNYDYIMVEGYPYCNSNAAPNTVITAANDYRMQVNFGPDELREIAVGAAGRTGFVFGYTV